MRHCCTAVLFLTLLLGVAIAEEQAGSSIAGPGSIGITYDEGLQVKLLLLPGLQRGSASATM